MLPHYFPQLPRSLDNVPPRSVVGSGAGDYYDDQLLRVSGENGTHVAYGGYLRDRPLPRAPLPDDYELADLKWEIQAAQAMGADGFFGDIMGYSGRGWVTLQKLVDAANELGSGFFIVPMIDTSGGGGAMGALTPEQVAAGLAPFLGKPSTYLEDGKLFLSCFAGENWTNDRWRAVFAAITAQHGLQVAFAGSLLDSNQANVDRLAEISEYLGGWMLRADPAVMNAPDLQVARAPRWARATGCKWVGTAHTQIVTPYTQHYFDEAANSGALRASWEKIIRDRCEHVQNVTWNDFSEGGQVVPSVARGWCQLALTAYYAQKWKHGVAPTITSDCVFLSHRDQPLDADYQFGRAAPMTQTESSALSPLQDNVEALSYLTAPAEITVSINGIGQPPYAAPAGEYVRTFPNVVTTGSNRHSVSYSRRGQVLGSVESPFPVTSSPIAQDRQYFFVSTLHGVEQQYYPLQSV
jgi:hypothetical protein